MKKFLIFLISIVTVVSFGLVTYYFLRNDEVINFKTTEVYCNVGDIVTVADLGKTVKKESNKTTYNYNAGDETVVAAIKFDTQKGYYVASKGGNYEVLISTSNKKFPQFKFTVHIGDGSETNPYFVDNEQTLSKIGNSYALSANYVLKSDILLSNDFAPIGFDSTSNAWTGFSGSFDGNNHTIVGSNYAFTTENAGLFYSLNGANVKNLTVKSFKINGAYSNAGVLAGNANNAVVSNVQINDSSIVNTKAEGVTGGLIGTVVGSSSSITTSAVNDIVLSASADETSGPATMGGFVGKLNQGLIRACLATGSITVDETSSKAAGFAGEMIVSTSYGSIQQSYAVVNSEFANFAGFVHTISTTGNVTNANYLKFLIGNYSVNGTHDSVKVKPEIIKTLFDEVKGIYGIKGYTELEDMLADSNYVYYTVNGQKEYWDSFIWKLIAGNLPKLYSTTLTPSTVSSEYFLVNNEKEYVYNTAAFMTFINECLATDGKIKNKNYVLFADIDLSEIDWKSIDVENSIIDGNGHKISNLNLKNVKDGNLSFFGTVDNSSIKNIVFENVAISADATNGAVLANVVKASDTTVGVSNVENITINLASEVSNRFTNLATIANQLNDGSMIKKCEITNFTINADATSTNVAGVVNTIARNSRVENANVNATLKAQSSVASVANSNRGSVLNITANIVINHTEETASSNIAGLVVANDGEIAKANVTLKINVQKSVDGTKIAGVAVANSGNISSVSLTGEGILTSDNSSNVLYVAGFVCDNNGRLTTSKCAVNTIGNFNTDKHHYVAGMAINNSGTESVISQCIVTSNIEGNTVAGAVVVMNNAAAKIDQIVVGAYNLTDKTASKNLIKGDRFVAGVVMDLRNGSVANVQAASQIYGVNNSTVSSLIVLIFPNGASFKNATINSALNGYGNFYSECWQDFRNASDAVKNELNYHTTGNSDRSFDILDYDASAGSLQSIIINETTARQYNKTYQTATFISEGVFFGAYQWPSYENTDRSSFFAIISDGEFKTVSTYKNAIIMSTKKGVFNLGNATFTKETTFNFDNVWSEVPGNGIELQFVQNI